MKWSPNLYVIAFSVMEILLFVQYLLLVLSEVLTLCNSLTYIKYFAGLINLFFFGHLSLVNTARFMSDLMPGPYVPEYGQCSCFSEKSVIIFWGFWVVKALFCNNMEPTMFNNKWHEHHNNIVKGCHGCSIITNGNWQRRTDHLDFVKDSFTLPKRQCPMA